MIIKTSKHKIDDANQAKLGLLDQLFDVYKRDLELYIDLIIKEELPLKINMSSALLPTANIKHSKYKREIYKQASGIIRSQLERSTKRRLKKYKEIYHYMMKNHKDSLFVKKKFSELNLNSILKSKWFKKPSLRNISINLTDEFFDIQNNAKHFDSFVNIILPFFNEKGTRALQINVPLNNHVHSNSLLEDQYSIKKNIQIKKIKGSYYIGLIWSKALPEKRTEGSSLAMDLGFNKLIATSDGQIHNGVLPQIYSLIARKQQGSNAFKKLLSYRDNEINRIINNIDFTNIKELILEDLNGLKKGKKFKNKSVHRWSYRKTITKLDKICDEQGITPVKVSPAFTSQTCSACGYIHEDNRKSENFLCLSCGLSADADINAASNILKKGTYSFFCQES